MKHSSDSPTSSRYFQTYHLHPQQNQPKPFLKSRQFYKPQAFIWNNPHRASQQMYKFYHSYNDQFNKNKQPHIEKLIEKDRQDADQQRIHRLIAFRIRTREQFYHKQHSREALEQKIRNGCQPSMRSIKTETGIPMEDKYKSQTTIKHYQTNKNKGTSMKNSQKCIKMQDAYRTSLMNHDFKDQEIKKLINDQNKEFNRQILSQFTIRKQNSNENIIKIKTLKKSKPITHNPLPK